MPKSVHTAQYRALLRLLIAKRRSAGLTQAALGQLLRKPQSFVSKFEKGERRLDVFEFVVIARALGTDPYRLLRQVEKSFSAGETK